MGRHTSWGRTSSRGRNTELCQMSHSMEVPLVSHTEYLLSNLDEVTGAVSLCSDLNLPSHACAWEPTEQDLQVERAIVDGHLAGKSVTVVVIGACGEEKISGVRAIED
mmetsp:Transcript_98467/g.273930  ORF Transcript_98467/g.273930 Transcript_98467/m.273930 type:complete len:108 (-) Transcript_98467:267-590(-)